MAVSRAHIIVFLLVHLLSSVYSTPLACPNVEDLSPCTCKRLGTRLHVVCANFNSSDTLQKAISILRDYNVFRMNLHEVYLTSNVPSDLFHGMHLKELRVEKSKMQFSQPAFTGLDASLTLLSLEHSSVVQKDDAFNLATLTELTELNIQSNDVAEVKDSWLKGRVPKVHTLVLDHNKIAYMGEHAFEDLKQLTRVSLSGNMIAHVSRSMFPRPARALKRIDLSHNMLHSVPSDIFADMPSLEIVVLTKNEIKTLPEQTWIDIWGRLNQVLLYENSLVCDEKLQWIKNLKAPNQLEGTCKEPSEMEGKSLKDIVET